MWASLPVLVSACLGFLRLASGLFEDEVGQHEWFMQQIGQPTALAFSADAPDKVLVASDSGVIASVVVKDGALQWRRIGSPDDGMRILRAASRGLVSVTQRGLVQAWKAATGDLTWQREYPEGVLDVLIAGPVTKQSVIVVQKGEMDARTMAGKPDWSVQARDIAPAARFWAATVAEEGVVCAVAEAKGAASSVHIEVSSGKVLKKEDLPASVIAGFQGGSYIIADTHVVFLSDGVLAAQSICGGGADTKGHTYDLQKIKTDSRSSFRLMPWQRTTGVFAATNGANTAIFGMGPRGVKHLRTFDGIAVVGPVYSVHDDETGQPVAVASIKEEGTQIQLLDPASGNAQPAIQFQGHSLADHGPAKLLLLRELSTGEHRFVLSAADHSLTGFELDKVSWCREEALASIKRAVFFGRAAPTRSEAEAARAATDVGLGALLGSAADLAKKPMEVASTLSSILPGPKAGGRTMTNLMPSARVPTNGEELRSFGADKLIITITDAVKLFAIEATSSEIVWQKFLGTTSEGSLLCTGVAAGANAAPGAGCASWMQLLPSSAAPNTELLVVAPGVKSQRLIWIDPLTGDTLHEEAGPVGASVASVVPLSSKKAASGKAVMPFVLIDSKRGVRAMPSSSPDAARLLEEALDKIFHYEVDRRTHVIQGFSLSSASAPLLPLWNVELGVVGEQILASASPEHREWDHVPVYIKGDASILFKYINKNLLAVVSEDHVHRGNVSSLNLYALDAVTGHVLHQSRIVGGAGPVHLVACDNWVMMHYWNMKKTRFEITIVEFFQAKPDEGPWNILFGGASTTNQSKSAHYLESPVPLQQTYIFPAGVTGLGVTATLKGITPRSVIMATTTDHIFRVSKDVLNPRRPHPSGVVDKDLNIPSQFAPTKEEAMPPYNAMLPLKPTDILTHYNPMSRVVGIASSPTALESTSIVFCYGLDLYFAPVQTAKAYDVLRPGFNYTLLYASVGSVLACFIVTSYLAKRKALYDRWR